MRRSLPAWALVAALLGAAAASHLGYQWLVVGLDRHDAGQYETVLAVAAAGQLSHGFGSLYGPYSGDNPAVLMHAPSYYRVVALGAAGLGAMGLAPIDASLVTGRLLTWASTVVLLLLVWQLTRIDGARRQAGLYAVALVASSPILGVLAIMLRPDTLGVALATGGVLLFMKSLQSLQQRPGRLKLVAAYLLFALAVCVKQQNVVAPLVASAILTAHVLRGRADWKITLVALTVGTLIGGAIFLIESWWTGGLSWETVIKLPGGAFREINYGGWDHVRTITLDCLKRSMGLVLLTALSVGVVGRRSLDLSTDRMLGAFVAAEIVALVPFCLFNKGAADNYALQGVVFAAILCGRLMDRALIEAGRVVMLRSAFVIASALLLANGFRLILHVESCRREEATVVASLLGHPAQGNCPPERRYFSGDQEFNRLLGRRELIHDEWLYGAFEAIGAAEPRSIWLRDVLTRGDVDQVVLSHEGPAIIGMDEPLDELGFVLVASEGRYQLWTR